MSTRLRTRPAALLLVMILVASLAGAGCGTGGGYVASGSIEVMNDWLSFEFIDAVRIAEVYGPDVMYYDVFLVPGDSLYVDMLYPTVYDVTVYWGDGMRITYFDVGVDSYHTSLVIALH